MSKNIETVNRYLDGFRKNDHAQILSCLTDDIKWTVYGAFQLSGKDAYDKAIDLADEAALAAIAGSLKPRFTDGRILIDGRDVTDMIRQETIVAAASRLAVLGRVRSALVQLQRAFRVAPGLVADGRDMGTVIFPDATLKIFLTAEV